MTRKVLIVGLILLAAFLPLVSVPVAVFVLDPRIFPEDVAQLASTNAPSVTLLALVFFRGPPSR